jgi:2-C-methyl-D-erythritol 4-phosphate cytidylyltransferase
MVDESLCLVIPAAGLGKRMKNINSNNADIAQKFI